MDQENNQEFQAPSEQPTGAQMQDGGDMDPQNDEQFEHHSSRSVIIVAVIAIVVVVLALMYIWGSSIVLRDQTGNSQMELPPVPVVDEQVEELNDVSTSDDIDAIEEDIMNTDLDNLDNDLDQIETELNAAI